MDIWQLVEEKSKQYGIDPKITKSIVQFESEGIPSAVGDNGNSVGLLQVNLPAHKLSNDYKEKLKDPTFNLDFQLPELKKYFDAGTQAGLQGDDLAAYVERYGQRPVWNENANTRIRNFFNNDTNTVTNSTPTATKTSFVNDKIVDAVTGNTETKTSIFNFIKLWGAYSVIIVILVVSIIVVVFGNKATNVVKKGVQNYGK